MKHKIIQYIIIIAVISAIAGSYFYFQSRAAMTINKAGLTSAKLNTVGLTSIKINSSQAGTLTSGLVGHWTFDGQDTNWTSATAGTTADRSGQGNTGTLTNMSRTTSPVPGKVGQAMYFDGSNDNIDLGSASSLNFTTENFTISFWINQRPTTNTQIVFSNGKINENGYEIMVVGDEQVHLHTSQSGTNQTIAAPIDTIVDNEWIHIAAVRNGTTGYIYKNGNNVTSNQPNITNPLTSTYNAKIGSRSTNTNFFNGLIDEVRVYNRALSASEITELYNMGR